MTLLFIENTESEESQTAKSEYLMEIACEQQALDKNRKYNCFTANQDCSILTKIRMVTFFSFHVLVQ